MLQREVKLLTKVTELRSGGAWRGHVLLIVSMISIKDFRARMIFPPLLPGSISMLYLAP